MAAVDRRTLLLALAAAGLAGGSGSARAERILRIATGGIAGTYYVVGSLVAAVVSAPEGARPCARGGSCGVPGLVAVVVSSHGSVANIEMIEAGTVESGFVQADTAHFARAGLPPFADRPRRRLRGLAKLYNETLHLCVRPDSGIRSVYDLPGKRIAVDEEGSGTLVDVRLVLAAYGLDERDFEAHYVKPVEALARMRDGALDGFFVVAGHPTPSVVEAVTALRAVLVPVDDPPVATLLERWPFFVADRIPADAYPGRPEVRTLGVGALWLVRDDFGEELAYGLLRALFHPSSRELLARGHPRAADIRPETALDSMTVPLHPGAARYYAEHGLLDGR